MEKDSMLTLAKIAEHISGELVGNKEHLISKVSSLDKAENSEISFLSNHKFESELNTTQAGCVLVSKTYFDQCLSKLHIRNNYIICEDPYLAFAFVGQLFDTTSKPANGISDRAYISTSAQLGKSVSVASGASIGDNTIIGDNVSIGVNVAIGQDIIIGANSIIYSLVSIYPNTRIGINCILHSNCVIGSDGFGYANKQGEWIKIPQTGGVNIGNNVEVGANACIDRGALKDTIIRDGVKIDNLCHIAHNVEVGENVAMAAMTGVAGSTIIGKNCTFSGRSSILGHLNIADNTHVTVATVINKSNSTAGVFSSGTGAQENKQWRKNVARFKQLDDMAKRIRSLEKQLQKKEIN
ncbi:MAG: UDP-3-O-(3-hydroxymyristoyl)glucosamine N-acyltransferase [Gammaproteobacteria bacterium]|nr:MAG: UDP-3-O-(3-hydroxymyristoyl)glucosamine N-acyltransferase [Gammaproteobacteria bacterium]